MCENPYKPFRRVRGSVDSAKRVTDERFGAWELGYNARCPDGWIVVRLDEHEARMRECEALRLEREDARAERDAAIAALREIAGDYGCHMREPADPSQPPRETPACREQYPDDRSYWCDPCIASAAVSGSSEPR